MMTLDELYERTCKFVLEWGGTPPSRDSSQSFRFIAEYLMVIDAEISIKMVPKEEKAPPTTGVP
jgi:hypothetical protein